MSNSRTKPLPDLVQDRRADDAPSELTHSSSTTDWKSLAEKASAECMQAKATIGDLFLERLQTAKRIRELEDEVKDLRSQIAVLEAKPPQKVNEEMQGAIDRQGSTTTKGAHKTNWQMGTKFTDSMSISDVVELLNVFNGEIFQAAALLGEVLMVRPRDSTDASSSPGDLAKDHKTGEELIGNKLVKILLDQAKRPPPEPNPLLVQATLQIFLVSFCTALVHYWCPEDPTYETFLSSIHRKVLDNEEQQIVGTWRAITRSYTQINWDLEGWKLSLFTKLDCILRIASWTTPSLSDRRAFEQSLEHLFKATRTLRHALGTKITSAELIPSVMNDSTHPGHIFQPLYMEDAYGYPHSSSRGTPREIVVGTTGMGLKQAVRERSRKGDVLYKNIVSARVALESTLLEALQPPPPRKKKPALGSKPNEAGK